MDHELNVGGRTIRVEAAGPLLDVAGGGWLVPPGPVTISHPFERAAFYRHGWHSWRPVRWVSLDDRDERHPGSWVGAVQPAAGSALLLGGLGLAARVEAGRSELRGWSEGSPSEWLLTYGTEHGVFGRYAGLLGERLGVRRRSPGRVWCSWYSYWAGIDEPILDEVLAGLDGLPFEVFQVDDGWQRAVGDWEASDDFPRGMPALADRIAARGYRPGLWIAPFVARDDSRLYREHPDLFLVDGEGRHVVVGNNWGGPYHALDLSRPAAVDFACATIERACEWGFTYLKLDFVFAGAVPGARDGDVSGDEVYRAAIEAIRAVAGEDTYLLACGAPIVPSLGVFDGLRIGPDVAPFWEIPSEPPTDDTYAEPASRHAVSTSLGRLWLRRLIATDPDVVFFRTRANGLDPLRRAYLRDLAWICDFVGDSDPPEWLQPGERAALAQFLHARPDVRRLGRYRFSIDGREVDFSPVALDDPAAIELAHAGGG